MLFTIYTMIIGTVLFTGDILMSCYGSERIITKLQIDIWAASDCRFYVIVHYLPVFIGINSIMLVAVERFVAIVLPMHFRAFVAPGMVKLQLTFVWLLTFVELIFPWYYIKVSFNSLWIITGPLTIFLNVCSSLSQANIV